MQLNNSMQLKDSPIYSASCEPGIDRHPLTVSPETSLEKTIALMSQTQSTCALIVEKSGQIPALVGIFTERDVVHLAATGQMGKRLRSKIGRVMTQPAIAISPTEAREIKKAYQVLCQHQIRHLPVVDDRGQLVGLITQKSLLRELSEGTLRREKAEIKNPFHLSCLSTIPSADSSSSTKICQLSHNDFDASVRTRFYFLMQNRLLEIIYQGLQENFKALLRQEQALGKSVRTLARQSSDVAISREVIALQSSLLNVNGLLAKRLDPFSAVAATDVTGKMIYWNKLAESLDRWSATEAMPKAGRNAYGHPLNEILFAVNNKAQDRILFETLFDKNFWEREFTIQRPEGSIFIALFRNSTLKNQQNLVAGSCSATVELAESQSEKRWSQLIETMNEGLVTCNAEGAIAYVNPKLSAMLGYSSTELIGQKWLHFIAPTHYPAVKKQIEKCQAGESREVVCNVSTGEVELLRKDGQKLFAIISTTPIQESGGDFSGSFSVLTDITERFLREEELQKYRDRLEVLVQVRTREKNKMIASLQKTNEQLQQEIVYRKLAVTSLRESERFIQRINDTTPNIVYLYHLLERRIIYVNRQFTQLLGYAPDSLHKPGTKFLRKNIHPDDWAVLKKLPERLASVKEGVAIESEYRFKHANGDWRWIHSQDVVFARNSDGVPVQILGTASDMTERKQTEAALSASEERYRAFVAQSSEAIYRIEFEPSISILEEQDRQIQQIFQNGRLAECNDVMAQMYGFDSASEILGISIDQLIPPSDSRNIQQMRAFICSGYQIDRAESHEIDAEGNPKYFLNNQVGILEDNKLVRMWGTQLDITALSKAQQALTLSESRYRLLAENATDMISRHSPEGVFLYVSPACRSLLGMEPDELLGKPICEFCHPDDLEAIATTQAAILQEPGVHAVSYRVIQKNSGYIWFETTARTVRNLQTGKILEIVAVSRDITRRKMAEEALKQSEERLTSILNSLQDVVRSTAVDTGELLYLNPIAETVYGRPLPELLANRNLWLEVVHPDDRLRVEQFFQTFLITGSPEIEYRIVRPSGEVRWLRDRTWLIGDSTGKPIRIDGLATDITESKRSNEALRQSEERFRQLAASVDQVFWIASIDMNQILYISPAYESISGRSCETLYERVGAWFEVIHPADRYRVKVAIAKQNPKHNPGAGLDRDIPDAPTPSAQNSSSFNQEFRIIRPDGSIRWVWARSFLIRNERGEVYRRTGVVVDITERKQIEENLLVTQQQLQYLLSSSPAVIYSAKASGNYATQFISDNVTTLLGYEPWEFIENEKFWSDRIHPEDAERVTGPIPKRLDRERHTQDYRFLHKNGTYRWLRDEIRLIRDAAGNPVELVGYWADITTQKAAEEEIRKALAKEKELSHLRSRFITLTSHEFRTPLCTILSSADLLEFYVEQATEQMEVGEPELQTRDWRCQGYAADGGPLAYSVSEAPGKARTPTLKMLEHVQRIQTAALHITQMLNDILVIGRAEAGALTCNPAPMNLENFCRQLVEEINVSARSAHRDAPQKAHPIAFVCRSHLTEAVTDEKLLRHILGNLLSNAIKYSSPDSTVHFELTFQNQKEGIGEKLENQFLTSHLSLPTSAAAIFRIQDTGIGIPLEDRARIFDSFYRGSNVGNKAGTGLGLAIVKKAVDVHGGQIAVESEVGAGTTFTVMLPLNYQYADAKVPESI